jgi:hypothetical protein
MILLKKAPIRRMDESVDPFEWVEREAALYRQAAAQVFTQPEAYRADMAMHGHSDLLGACMMHPLSQFVQEQQAFKRQVALLRAHDPVLANLAAHAARHWRRWAPEGTQMDDVIDVQARVVPDGPTPKHGS